MTAGGLPLLDADAFAAVIAGVDPALVLFSTSTCAPCGQIKAVLAELLPVPGVAVGVVDIQVASAPAIEWKVQGIPTLIAFRAGQELARTMDVPDRARLAAWLDELAALRA